jgi:hypothetical protein
LEATEAANHAGGEYRAVLDDAAFGGATGQRRSCPFHLARDPGSRWTGANGGLAFFAYSTNYLIDLKDAVIVDEASTAVREAEVTAQQRSTNCVRVNPKEYSYPHNRRQQRK